MLIIAPPTAAVKFDSAAIVTVARPFGLGVLRKPSGPSALDAAYESGRSIGLEYGRPVATPGSYTEGEAAAFEDGLAEASAILDARESDHLAELAGESAWHDMTRAFSRN